MAPLTSSPSPFAAAPGFNDAVRLARWSRSPYHFVREALHATPDPWQERVLAALGRGECRISIRSGNGVGKTTLLAWLAIWFPFTRYPSKTVVTAPTSQQLYDALWVEIRHWLSASPTFVSSLFEVTSERLSLVSAPDSCFVSARTSRAEQPEALQGIHATNVLLIVDEASGVPEAVYEA